MVHQPVSRGLAVFADAWLSRWLAEISADLRETVAHQRWCHDNALYKSTTLLFFYFYTSLTNFIIQQSPSFEGVCLPLHLTNCRFPVLDSQPTATEL